MFKCFAFVAFVAFATTALLGQALPPISPAEGTSTLVQPIYSLNVSPVKGANRQVVGVAGQATYYYWAVANYPIGSVVSPLGGIRNAPNTLSGGNYVQISPFGYPAGVTSVDFLRTTIDQAPSGACNCAVATGVTSGTVNDQSNSLSSYTVPVFNPNNFVFTLTNEVQSGGGSHYILRQGWPYPGTQVSDLSTVGAGGLPAGVANGSFLGSNGLSQPGVYQKKPVLDAYNDFGFSTGSNAGVLIQAAHDSARCPSTGCVIDARAFISGDIIAGLNLTKPVHIIFGATVYSVTAQILLNPMAGLVFEGAGQYVTVFNWAGNNSTAMFRQISVQQADFSGFSANASTSAPLTAFFTSERGATGNPTNNSYRNIHLDGTNGGVTDGFKWVTGAGGDAGNDTFTFDKVSIANYSNAAWNSNTQTQSQGHTFFDSQASSNGYGKYGYYGQGSFAMYNQQFSDNTVVDIDIVGSNNGVLVSGGLSIGSNRFYIDPGTNGTFAVTIENFNFSSTGLNADGYIGQFQGAGPYLLINNSFGNNSALAAKLYLTTASAGQASGVAIGNNVYTSLTQPFVQGGAQAWELIGNTRNSGPPTAIPDYIPGGLGLGGPAPTVAAAQVGLGGTTAAASSCGSLAGAAGCMVINVAGTTHYVPYY